MEKLKRPSLSALLSAAALAVIAFLALTTVYSSDDFSYSTYFDNGIRGYLPLAVQHYQTMNGRALVHLAAHLILHFGSVCFCLVCLGCCAAIPLLTAPRKDRGTAVCLFLSLFLAMPMGILNQGVLWISAFCNYTLPCAMLCALAALLFRREAGRGSRIAGAVLALLCGATTEQSGVMALAAAALYLCVCLRDRRKDLGHGLLCLVLTAVGYGTIYLSPSTRQRFLSETQTGAASSFLSSLVGGLRSENGIFQASVLFPLLLTALFLLCAYRLRRSKCFRAVALLGVPAVWAAYLMPWNLGAAALLGVYGLAALTGLLLMWEREERIGALMLCAVASACIMLPTNSIDHRSMVPLYLLLSAATAALGAELLGSTDRALRSGALAAVFLAGMLCIAPSVKGYWSNYQVDRMNRQHVEEYRRTGILRYCMDYDMDHTWMKPCHDGMFQLDYLRANGLDTATVVHYYSSVHPAVYLDGQTLPFPAVTQTGDTMLLPLRGVIEGLGGTVEAAGHEITVTLEGRSYRISREREYEGLADVEGEGLTATYRCSTRLSSFSMERGFFETLFGVVVTQDEAGVHISR